jgi:hypothetical protein
MVKDISIFAEVGEDSDIPLQKSKDTTLVMPN